MKIFNKILSLGFVAALTLTSCELTTISPSTMDDQTVFSNETMSEFNVLAIYECLATVNSHRGRYLTYYGTNTDVDIFHSIDGSSGKSDPAWYKMSSTNDQLNVSTGPYASLYTGVERANLTIKGLRNYGDSEALKVLLGEALVARAMLYSELLKAYGEVPARFDPIDSETIYLNKSDKDVIYKQLLSDLEESFDYLTYSSAASTARAGLAFAKGLYARLALYASGYSLRPDEGCVGTGSGDERVRPSDDPELQASVLYPKALEALKDVIASSGLYLEDYQTLWYNLNNCNNLTAGKETIFVVPFSDTRGRWNYTHAIKHEAYTEYCPLSSGRGGETGPAAWLYWWYDEHDCRRDISCVNYTWSSTDDGVLPYPTGSLKWYHGKYRYEWMVENPYTGGNDDGVKPVYMRYADILLMAAEIANSSECGARDESFAKECLLQVLNRAYVGYESEASAIVDALSGEAAIFAEIKKQRALEFVGEFLRKADLIRWNELKTAMDLAADEMVAIREGGIGPITGNDYSDVVGSYLWYYRTTDDYGFPTIVTQLTHDADNEPDSKHDWQPYLNSSGSTTKYYSSSSFVSSGYDWAVASVGFYNNDPDTKQWWPIPETNITSAQGNLVNDYGY